MKTTLVVLSLAGALLTIALSGQGRWLSQQARMATPDAFDGTFNFCRVMYRNQGFGGGRGGGGWSTDYPRADMNLSIRLSELTKTRVSLDSTGTPNHLVVRLTDDELFQCPFILMAAVGNAYFDELEAARLRAYLLKGGFLWVDDFWGSQAWDNWEQQITNVLPPPEFSIVDIPNDHAMYRTQFQLSGVPQIPAINFWFRSGGGTSERGADSAEVHARSISDPQGRIMVLMTHNTDISDSWEREGEDPSYFRHFSVGGYALAINVLLYTMSH
jgi:hypothetical protein